LRQTGRTAFNLRHNDLANDNDAKFDGKFYPVEDDPGHTMTSVKLLSPTEVEITSKRGEKIVSVLHLSVMPDGKSIHGVFESKENNTTSSYELRKLQRYDNWFTKS